MIENDSGTKRRVILLCGRSYEDNPRIESAIQSAAQFAGASLSDSEVIRKSYDSHWNFDDELNEAIAVGNTFLILRDSEGFGILDTEKANKLILLAEAGGGIAFAYPSLQILDVLELSEDDSVIARERLIRIGDSVRILDALRAMNI